MDINLLFKAGMKSCGRVLRVLPKDEIGTPMDYMMEVLRDSTLPSLNIIFPRLFPVTFSINQLISVSEPSSTTNDMMVQLDTSYSYYRVPREITEGQDIVLIKSCVPAGQSGDTRQGSIFRNSDVLHTTISARSYGRFSSAQLYEAAAFAQLNYADRQLAGQFTNAFRYKFYPPNILAILSSYATDGLVLNATFGLKNDESLLTIEDTAYEEIRKLFVLDLKSTIYSEYGLFSTVETPGGPLELGIGDWSSAEDTRNELFSELQATSHFRTSSMRTG